MFAFPSLTLFKTLRSSRCSQNDLDTLFNYVLLDDVPHPHTPLPEDILPSSTPHEVIENYRLCWQLLEYGVDRSHFRQIIKRIAFSGTATPDEQRAFKYARAKFKHMRFTCANIGKVHRYPFILHIITIIMGNMQDAFKNKQRWATLINGCVLWVALTPLYYWLIQLPLMTLRPDTPDGILAYQREQNAKLAKLLTTLDATTGHEFHVMRKIISRRVAYNDTLRTLRPDTSLDHLSEYLATINGMMGDMHDDLIEKKINGSQNYHRDRFQPPREIIERITTFLARSGALPHR